jgi:methyl halide transferase
MEGATIWNQCYANGNTPWDKGQPAPPLVAWLREHSLHGRVLVPGCGPGHDAALIAAQGAQVLGLDIAPLTIERARAAYPLLDWLEGDLFTHEGSYDAVFEHTCFCALSPALRADYVAAMKRLLRPGGRLVGIWFINPDLDPGESGPPFPTPLPELEAWFAEGFRIVEDAVPAVAFPGREGRERWRIFERVTCASAG